MTESPSLPRSRARLSPKRRSEIMDAAIGVVIRDSYERAAMETIAAAAGASKVTLYRHWGDKATLISAAAAERSGIHLEDIDTGSIESDLLALSDMLARRAQRNVALVLALAQPSLRDPQLRVAVRHVVEPLGGALASLTRAAVERGEIAPERAEFLPHLIVGALFTPVLIDASASGITTAYLQDFTRRVIVPFLLPSP